ncbi:MAG: hypothetical protein ABI182_02630 [Candidatus Baltobacteraceae bacterium]
MIDRSNLSDARHRVTASSLDQLDEDEFTAFIETYAQRPEMLNGETVRTIINQQKSYEVGVRMAAQAREQDQRHERLMARLIQPTVPGYTESGRTIHLIFELKNKSPKTIRHLIAAIEVDDRVTHNRIALSELRIARTIPGESKHHPVRLPDALSALRRGRRRDALSPRQTQVDLARYRDHQLCRRYQRRRR